MQKKPAKAADDIVDPSSSDEDDDEDELISRDKNVAQWFRDREAQLPPAPRVSICTPHRQN